MQLQDDLRSLAEHIGGGDPSDRGYTLLLGSGVGVAAGVPSFAELASRAGISADAIPDRRIVERLLWDLPVPPFYYDVAGLVRDGSFPRVITTGYDDLLERALGDAGLRRGNHFVAVDLGATGRTALPSASARIRIARSHGASSITHAAMDRALGQAFGKGRDRLVVVGYEFESPSLDSWLASLDGGELWWVAPSGGDEAASRLRWRGEWHALDGDAAAPAAFFGQLSLLLLHLPATSVSYPDGGADMPSPGDAELDALYLQGRLNQASIVKRSIEQRITSSGADPAALTQLTAQADEITRLEQQAASGATPPGADVAPPNPAAELLGRFENLRTQLARLVGDSRAPVDADTMAFVDGQIDALRREAGKERPNVPVVAAAGAALDGLLGEVASYVGPKAS